MADSKNFPYVRRPAKNHFGLSNAQAAATLAAVMVGYNVILGQTPEGEPIRLLNESVLNGTILMILVTCTMASFSAQRGAHNLAATASSETDETGDHKERIIDIRIVSVWLLNRKRILIIYMR